MFAKIWNDFKTELYVLVCISVLILSLRCHVKKKTSRLELLLRQVSVQEINHDSHKKKESDELYVCIAYIVMPTVTMKCLPGEVHLSNLPNGSINEPNGI